MKPLFLSLFAAFGLTAMADDYNYLEVLQTSGNTVDVELATMQKITFVRGQMVVTTIDGDTREFALSGISKLYFSAEAVPVEVVNADPSDAAITAIYTLDGRCLPTRNADRLPQGVYIIRRADGSTSKVKL